MIVVPNANNKPNWAADNIAIISLYFNFHSQSMLLIAFWTMSDLFGYALHPMIPDAALQVHSYESNHSEGHILILTFDCLKNFHLFASNESIAYCEIQ